MYGFQTNLGGRMVIFPGGVPIWHAGQLQGAVGASGGLVEEDHACALAGVLALGMPHRSVMAFLRCPARFSKPVRPPSRITPCGPQPPIGDRADARPRGGRSSAVAK